jgi:hypothetical protein
MTLMLDADMQVRFRSSRQLDLRRDSRAVERKRMLLPSPLPRAALPAPAARQALAAAASQAVMTAEDLRAPSRPRVLGDAPMGDRFRYWYGRSGRRYLFSAVAPGDVADLDGVVVLVAGGAADRPEHVGLNLPVGVPAGAVYVHLLAETDAARADIIADLAPRAA